MMSYGFVRVENKVSRWICLTVQFQLAIVVLHIHYNTRGETLVHRSLAHKQVERCDSR